MCVMARTAEHAAHHQTVVALNFIFDRMVNGIGIPNLAQHQARPYTTAWRQFDRHWPYVIPLRFIMYLRDLGLTVDSRSMDQSDQHSWYPVAFSWFDFSIDYFALMSEAAHQHRVLFYYHEGDNPARMRDRLDQLADHHGYPKSRFLLVSANTAADHSAGCAYFDDHECFFSLVNQHQTVPDHGTPKMDFTLLSRVNKWWRASITADLDRHGLLKNSLWSYNNVESPQDAQHDNPISVHEIDGLNDHMHQFLVQGPYRCDQFDHGQQNDHHWVNTDLYQDSFLHIVLETHFDADQSGGTFLTEKTYKAIKYGQPFVLAAPAGSVAVLRDHGYRVFDDVIDHAYDTIDDPTQRWITLRREIARLKPMLPWAWQHCLGDIRHNQEIFHRRMKQAVNIMLERLQ